MLQVEYVKSCEEAKKVLRSGKLVVGPRSVGKTTAIMEVIHEDHAGDAIIVCFMDHQASWFSDVYKRIYPQDKGLIAITQDQKHRIIGYHLPIYVDVYNNFIYENALYWDNFIKAGVA